MCVCIFVPHLCLCASVRLCLCHGNSPVHIGDPAAIGVTDLSKPSYGDAVTVKHGEVPVFWACGVTPQQAVMQAKLPLVICHAPGHMFVGDVLNVELSES